MHEYRIRVVTVTRSFEEGAHLAEALRFPEATRLQGKGTAAREAARRAARTLMERGELADLHRRSLPGEPELLQVDVEVLPRRGDPAWREPVVLVLDVVTWTQEGVARVARVPALGVEVVLTGKKDLEDLVRDHVTRALARENVGRDLVRLALLDRPQEVELEERAVVAKVATAIERAREEEDAQGEKSPVETMTDPLGVEARRVEAFERDPDVARLGELLGGPFPASVVLVGAEGVGKTALLRELARRGRDFGLGKHRFLASTGTRLISGATGLGMWQDRCLALLKDLGKEPTLLHLGGLIELLQVGRSEGNAQGVGSFLRPWIERREVQVVVECTPDELAVAEREDPHLVRVLERLDLEPPGPEAGRRILGAVATRDGGKHPPGADVLDRVDRLHRRFATASAYPGRPLRFLRDLGLEAGEDRAPTLAEASARFARQTGLPRFMLDDAVRLDLDATQAWFGERLLGQEEASARVLELLVSIKAGMGRPGRPLASFLFVGPTGVGKTEMAKTLARFLFGSAERMTRIDMSEYSDPWAARRLVGGVFGGEGTLTAPVRDQPFSVVLLDEAEKADPTVFDMLLGVLGEGRLTDAGGRLADFSNAVVILTSNLGARGFGRAEPGFGRQDAGAKDAARHFTRAAEQFFRPELVNRFDRVVPFLPLDRAVARAVTARELESLRTREGIRYRDVDLAWDPGVVELLAGEGYDARYGARPLRRTVERRVVAPLARALNAAPAARPLRARVTAEGGEVRVEVEPVEDPAAARSGAEDLAAARVATRLRRRGERILEGEVTRMLRNEEFRLGRLLAREAKRARRPRARPRDVTEERARWARLGKPLGQVTALVERVARYEEETFLALYGIPGAAERRARFPIPGEFEAEMDSWSLQLVRLHDPGVDHAALTLLWQSPGRARDLARAWIVIAREQGLEVRTRWVRHPAKVPALPETATVQERIDARFPPVPTEAVEAPWVVPDEVVALILEFEGPAAWLRFRHEGGGHAFLGGGNPVRCYVRATSDPVDEASGVSEEMLRKRFIEKVGVFRTYDAGQGWIAEGHPGGQTAWKGKDLVEPLATLVDEHLTREVRDRVEGAGWAARETR